MGCVRSSGKMLIGRHLEVWFDRRYLCSTLFSKTTPPHFRGLGSLYGCLFFSRRSIDEGGLSTRSIVYIDGYNFYYGVIRGTPYKWLDIEACFRRIRPHDDLRQIYYFTALVKGASGERQKAYLQALRTSSLVKPVLGKYKKKQIRCRVRDCRHQGNRVFDSFEEKRTDVNIALQIMDDVQHNRADRFIIVSGDSDLVPAIHLAKQKSPQKRFTVCVPARHARRGAATELRNAADKDSTFPVSVLAKSQFPVCVQTENGGCVRKPSEW